ncbi:Polysaccharide deacetylase domain protein [Stigmatella aurantiaca DW4/3-1]|uniref:Polysaccharide deacetylase domain protein n=2 Tax=Stigmatella aurantiaca (strain DW4/3-1) TaxID=378806 RepID=E3FU84_STIAD|nr:Polysaccharide deacetylase domain protein [Stigmatella aurantiaca DW4/3-1]
MHLPSLAFLWHRNPPLHAALLTGLLLTAACTTAWTEPSSEEQKPSDVSRLLPPGSTAVTLIFSDTLKSQTRVGPLFAKYGLHATLYVSSGRIGFGSGYLSLGDLRALAEAGHEVGSHTLDHEELEDLPPAEVRRQVCDDRVALMGLGFSVTSFSYPFSSDTPPVRQIVSDCAFNSASATGLIRNPTGCPNCPLAETLPPLDPFRIRAVTSIKADWTLENLQSLVLQAEGVGGGWIMLSFHQICEGCATYSISEAKLDAFLAWLAPRASRGTYVMTTHELVGGPVKPPIQSDGGVADAGPFDAGVPDAGSPDAGIPDGGPPGESLPLPNPSLETDSDEDNVPDCWKRQNPGASLGGWLRTSESRAGKWAQRARIGSGPPGERRLVVLQDSGACALAVTPGRSYRLSAWYKTDSQAGFVADYRTSTGNWVSWTTGPDLRLNATSYAHGTWTTPPLPADATHLSIGLALRAAGFLLMEDFALEALAPPP